MIISPKTIADHKRRVDRGGIYYGYFQMIATTTILVKIFNINQWWVYLLGALFVIILRYLAGYWDEKKKVLANEQQGYNDENPTIQKILNDLDFIKNKLI